jgi:pimeloyl-ACP methyl ester carboxylesterase
MSRPTVGSVTIMVEMLAAPIGRAVDLDVLLASHLKRGLQATVLEHRRAIVVFDTGDGGMWTIDIEGGRGRARRGGAVDPTLRVTARPDVLADIVQARTSGVNAFLAGDLTVRGDLALALQLDGLFGGDVARDVTHPRAFNIDAMGVRTAYLEAGPPDAAPVLLLHGLGATNASLLPVLADLAVDHRVIAPDLPGFGASSAPSSPYNPAWFAAWLEAFQSATHSRGAVVIGNSLGGRIALEGGLTHPRSVRALVLLTPSPAFVRLRQWVPLVRIASPELARLPMPQMSHRMVVEGIRVMFSQPDRLPQEWYDAAADEARRVLRKAAHRVAFFSCARQIYLEDAYGKNGFWQRLPGLAPPALFLWGDRDRLVPSSFARHVAAALPDAGQVVMEDCGHVPQFEHPAETMAMIRGFLEHL